jgi:hypothetical protein
LPGLANHKGAQACAELNAIGFLPAPPPNQFKWARRCGILVVLCYFIRGSVLPWYLHMPDSAWIMLTVAVLFIGAAMIVTGGGEWRWSWAIVLLAFAVGICVAEQPKSSALHWLGIALLILPLGPVVLNSAGFAMRSAAWRLTVSGLTALTAIFVAWYVLHLPCPGGRSPFAGFMNQSMILGPIAGLGVLIAAARAIHGRSWRWGLLALLGLIPVLASGSRVATLATGAAGSYLLIRRKPMLGGLAALGFLVAVCSFIARGGNATESDSVGAALSRKGIENTRTDLWQARIDEFKSSPLLGIGIAMGTGSGSAIEADGAIRVEPGSSYLAVLAMTGALGTVAFFSALGILLFGFASNHQQAPVDKDILSVVGIFLAVNGVAEGWILGFGSPLCFLFWLWLGNVGDAALQPVRAIASRRQFFAPRFARPIVAVTTNSK